MDRSTRLLLFLDVVDAGSFTAAAERRHVNRSVISKQIRALERELEVQLFNRSTRSVALTGIGREIYQSALKLREALDETGDVVRAHQEEPRGTLRITCPVHFGRLHVTRGLRLYLKRYPDMHVDLQLDDTPVNLIGGGFDIGIRIAQLDDSNLIARPLARNKRILCASPGFIACHGAPGTLDELIGLPAAIYSRDGFELDRLHYIDQTDGLERRVRLHPKIKANDPEVLKQAVLAGVGYSMASLFHVSEELKDGRLVPLLPALTLSDAPAIQLVYPHRRYLPQKTRRFIECMQETVGDPPFWETWWTGAPE
ncbi:LysR family transcriptional regulator [Larsenimonas suaedae]|uniref:LysR family transcriptional regulator n=1 Tax=Larsenimonas suaedae TaxID=1851019 RepID=A0ABU1GXB7_9GAMM|nr:LysR family transcriptional regulator [Larsenimonas suaedae]MCM2971428.1 LysR family transcriptional regulator [Larsenimonas suaedae]MDR5896684.1 LysR family transcriptional regulator [Larsenimonas suaedae]